MEYLKLEDYKLPVWVQSRKALEITMTVEQSGIETDLHQRTFFKIQTTIKEMNYLLYKYAKYMRNTIKEKGGIIRTFND